jgi:two-component system, NtrC family, sensor kinase
MFMNKSTVLVVDDEPLSVRILCHHLEEEYATIVATNGEQTLLLARGDCPPSLILMDVLMPGMNGYDVCAALKADPVTAGIPVILVTGLSDEADEQQGLNLGAVDYIHKPFSPFLVRARIRNQLDLKKHRDHLESLVKERTIELQLKQQQLAELNTELECRVADEVHKNREKDIILLQQEKLASLGHLAAGVAHEINNPMGFIMSNLRTLNTYTDKLQQYLLVAETATSDEQRACAAELYISLDLPYIREDLASLISETLEGAERVRQIVLDLKDFASNDNDSMNETDLNHCIRSTANIIRSEITSVADLNLQLAIIPSVICNPQQINQVIANLLINAAHAIEGRGCITISTMSEGDHVFITVDDTGHGISAAIRESIFDPFFTTRDVGQGIGLGLSSSYGIIKKHGGTITLKSESGAGSTFVVALPIGGPGSLSDSGG